MVINGPIIVSIFLTGRDSIVGIALFLTHYAKQSLSCKGLRDTYPSYFMSKNKIELNPTIDVDSILVSMKEKYKNEEVNSIDGVKIDFETEWVHLRKSNTEPIIRIYTESTSLENAKNLANKIINEINELI